MLFISIHSILNNILYIYIHTHKHDRNNSYIECSNTLDMKSFSTHIYVLKQTAFYTETTRLYYIVILDFFLRDKHIHNFTHCMS